MRFVHLLRASNYTHSLDLCKFKYFSRGFPFKEVDYIGGFRIHLKSAGHPIASHESTEGGRCIVVQPWS